jgi:hypothetical protein
VSLLLSCPFAVNNLKRKKERKKVLAPPESMTKLNVNKIGGTENYHHTKMLTFWNCTANTFKHRTAHKHNSNRHGSDEALRFSMAPLLTPVGFGWSPHQTVTDNSVLPQFWQKGFETMLAQKKNLSVHASDLMSLFRGAALLVCLSRNVIKKNCVSSCRLPVRPSHKDFHCYRDYVNKMFWYTSTKKMCRVAAGKLSTY